MNTEKQLAAAIACVFTRLSQRYAEYCSEIPPKAFPTFLETVAFEQLTTPRQEDQERCEVPRAKV